MTQADDPPPRTARPASPPNPRKREERRAVPLVEAKPIHAKPYADASGW